MRRLQSTLCWLVLLAVLPVHHAVSADPPERPAHERGLPIIRTYSARALRSIEHPVDASTYAALQAPSGALLFANDAGIVRFDGIRWRTTSGPIGTPFGLTIGPDGQIYASYTSKLARLSEGLDGQLREHDLADLAAPGVEVVHDFWIASATSREVYFGSAEQLLRLADGRLTQIEANGPYSFGNVAHGRLFVNALGRGVQWVDGERSGLLAGSEFLAEHRVYGVLEQPAGMALLLLDGQGLYRFDASQPETPTLQPFAEALTPRLISARVYSGLALSDGGFAIGTRTAGVFLLDRNGVLVMHLDQAAGLASNVVFHLLEDAARQIWVSHDQDLSVIEYPGQLSVFNHRQGVTGPPERVSRGNDSLYLSTRSGAYALRPDPQAPGGGRMQALLTEQITTSDTIDSAEQTLVASEWGLYSIGAGAPRLDRSKSLRKLLPLSKRPDWLLSNGNDGVLLWQRQRDRWRPLPATSELQRPIDSMLQHEERFWTSAGLLTPLSSFALDWTKPEAPTVIDVRQYDSSAGVPAAPVVPQVLEGRLLLSTLQGLLQRDGERFIPAPDFQQFQASQGHHLWQLHQLGAGRLLLHDRQRIAYAERDPTGQWLRRPSPLDRLPGGTVIKSVLVEADGVVWIATDSELYRHDPAQQSRLPPPPILSVVGIALDAGGPPALARAGQALTAWQPAFRGPRDLHLEFAASPATLSEGLRFRSRLEGYDRQWSEWSSRSEREYTNLPAGQFRFLVQAQDMYGQRSTEAVLEIQIAPTPWQHPLAWLLYAVLGALLLWLVGRWQMRRLAARNRALEAEVHARTVQLREAALHDPLTGLHNRRYLSELLQSAADDPAFARHQPLRADDSLPLLLGLIDIDHFKQVNDRHGHAAGDAVLCAVGQAIGSRLAADSVGAPLVCRWGGEEFLFIARVDQGSEADVVAALLEQVTLASAQALPAQLMVSASIGWLSLSSLALAELDSLLNVADQLLYRAKRAGRAQAYGAVSPAPTQRATGAQGLAEQAERAPELPDGRPRILLRTLACAVSTDHQPARKSRDADQQANREESRKEQGRTIL